MQLIWCLELDARDEFGPPERIAPDGIVEIVFHYRDPVAVRMAGESFKRQPRASAVIQTRRFLEFHPLGATGIVSIRLRPWGACQFLRVPLSELADRVVSAEDLWGSMAELREHLGLGERSMRSSPRPLASPAAALPLRKKPRLGRRFALQEPEQ